MNTNNKKLRVGVYGILIHDNSVLMVRTKSGSRWIYNFPGGGVEPDEGLGEALIRECQEEIGADVIVKDQIYSTKELFTHDDFTHFYMFNLYYVIELKDKKTITADDTKWFPIDNLPLNEMLEVDKEFVMQCSHSLFKNV